MGKINNVWVFSDSADRYADLLAGARQLGEHVNAVIWDERDVTEVKQADAVYLLCGKTDKQRVENYAETFASLIRKEDGKTLILLAATRRGKGPAAKLSVLLQSALVNDVTLLERNGDDLYAEHRMYGGLAFGREKVNTAVAVITLASGVYEPLAEVNAATPHSLRWITSHPPMKCSVVNGGQKRPATSTLAKRAVSSVLAVAYWRKRICKWSGIWPLRWMPKWAVRVRLPKANTGWIANVTLAFPACC